MADGNAVSFDDNDINAVNFYYQVTAVNSVVGGTCESEPAMSVDGIHNFVTVTTDGLDENGESVSVYPNPARARLTVEAEGLRQVTLINVQGQIVYDAIAEGNQTNIDLAGFVAGLYVLRIDTENGVVSRQVSIVK